MSNGKKNKQWHKQILEEWHNMSSVEKKPYYYVRNSLQLNNAFKRYKHKRLKELKWKK